MIEGIQEPRITWTVHNATSSNTMPNITSSVTMPYQNTPRDVYKYLREMDFTPSSGSGGDLWMRNGTTSYFTWEQAVTYCLIKPFLNP